MACIHSQAPIQMFGVEGRYATALYSAAAKQKQLDAVEKDMNQLKVGDSGVYVAYIMRNNSYTSCTYTIYPYMMMLRTLNMSSKKEKTSYLNFCRPVGITYD